MPLELPQHIAVIMDGNGRWARQRGLARADGHKAGAQAVRAIVTECRKLGVPYLTLYTFSRENWSRPREEISTLFGLLVDFLRREAPRMSREGIRLNVLGDMDALPVVARTSLRRAIQRTAPAPGESAAMTLNLALNYGGRDEILRAVRLLAAEGTRAEDITEEVFRRKLYTAGQPDPDLVIRTSGELRISNYLLFQCAYSEFYFCDALWPDFTPEKLHEALRSYAARNRRFGKTQEQCP